MNRSTEIYFYMTIKLTTGITVTHYYFTEGVLMIVGISTLTNKKNAFDCNMEQLMLMFYSFTMIL